MQIYFLVDRSGSMAARHNETVNAINHYVDEIKKTRQEKKTKITLATFDSSDPFVVVRNRVNLAEWNPITEQETLPRGMTPLYDAIVRMVEKIEEKDTRLVSLIILTDGAENASKVGSTKAKEALDRLRDKKYDISYIGADFDAFSSGQTLGIDPNFIMNNQGAGNLDATFSGLVAKTSYYAGSGVARSFSDEERTAAVGGKISNSCLKIRID